ncbi:sugar MFS transporter [Telluria mixta]|uniref:Sugar MFS transporter n=1 Tax=Telluria mixta TaxID=34071 RepID=A0ABT2BS32_9BURK|nr:sugar MFS transporter [Telluria mixta]MCS0627924.1 sugar MFS transporter [Telluria mixta]WEM93957.1 sugar MFS transporter [Telluria mixta]
MQPVSPSTTMEASHRGHAPLAIITMLFFMWGLLTSLNDVLIPHLKAVYTLSYLQAMLVQFCFFSAYFLVSLPAGRLVRRLGYQGGVVAGLGIAALGCALFYPAATGGYGLFLLALFVLAAGVTILQVAANPYVTALGAPHTASSRLTLTQAFNALGTAVAPTLGGMLILSGPADESHSAVASQAHAVQLPYLGLAAALAVLALLFAVIRLPRMDANTDARTTGSSLLRHARLALGAMAIFLYVGGEVSIGSFMISFLGERDVAGLDTAGAARYVSFYWAGAMVGRFLGFAAMRVVSPGKALACNAACAIALVVCAVVGHGHGAMWALIAVGLFNSIMFPTIFSMALQGLGPRSGEGSGILCMAIVGGALIPFVQGMLADAAGLHLSFLVPLACYVFVLFYGIRYAGPVRPT